MNKYIILLLIFAPKAYSQFQIESVVHNQEVISTDTKTDDVDTIESQEINEQMSTSIDDIFSNSTNATTARGPRSSAQSIQVRGLDANKIMIMVDGVRQNYREGHSAMNPIDLENLKRVEIYTNSSDFSKGGSLGGGVQFVTKDASDYLSSEKDFGQEIKVQSSSADAEQRVNAKVIFKKKNYSGLLSLTRAHARDLSLNDNTTLENSSYKDFSSLAKLQFKKFNLSYEYYLREDNNPLDPSLNPPNEFQDLLADSVLTKNSFLLSYDDSLKLYLNNYTTDKKDRLSRASEFRSINTTGLSYKGKTKNLSYGFELYRDELNSKLNGEVISSFPQASSINSNIFLEQEFAFNKYKIVPGLRASRYELQGLADTKSASELSKKLYQELEVMKDGHVFLSYSEGFNAPRVTEVYPSGLHSPGDDFMIKDNFFIPNLDLTHERSFIKELGFKFEKSFSYLDKLSFSASVYENDVDNYINIQRIDRSFLDEEDGTSQFINISKVHLNGAEAKLNYLYDRYDFGISYSQIRGRNKTDALYLEDLPADQYIYTFRAFFEGATFGYTGNQAMAQNRVNPETLQRTGKTPGYFIHNVFTNINLNQNFELGIRINNLFNQEYRRHASHINEAAEDFRLSLQYKLNTI